MEALVFWRCRFLEKRVFGGAGLRRPGFLEVQVFGGAGFWRRGFFEARDVRGAGFWRRRMLEAQLIGPLEAWVVGGAVKYSGTSLLRLRSWYFR